MYLFRTDKKDWGESYYEQGTHRNVFNLFLPAVGAAEIPHPLNGLGGEW